MTPVDVRLASGEDISALAGLRRAWVEEQVGGPVLDEGFDDRFAAWVRREQEQRVVWLAESAGGPIGMLNMLVFTRMPKPGQATSRWGYLANLFVLAGHRGSGVGGRLLDGCVQYADAHEFARIVLSPSERSRPLYRRHGFRPADSLLVRRGRD